MMYCHVNRPVRPEMMMNRMLQEMCMPPRPHHGPHRPMGFPVDVKKGENAYTLLADLPGVKLEQVSISVENDVLTIAVQRPCPAREEMNAYILRERCGRPAAAERAFRLEGIDQDAITAAMEDGVLTVTLPKEAPAEGKGPRRIAINGGMPALEAPAE